MLKIDQARNNQLQFHPFPDILAYITRSPLYLAKTSFRSTLRVAQYIRSNVHLRSISERNLKAEYQCGEVSGGQETRARFIPWLDGEAWEPLRKAFEVIEARCSDDISQPVRCLSHLDSSQSASSKYERYDPESRVKTDFGNTCCAVKCIGDRTREHAPVCIQGVSL